MKGYSLASWPFNEKPLLVFWETTKACLLKCLHCRAEAITEPLPGELTTEEALGLIDQVAGFGKPSPILVFTGGDLLMRRDIWDLLEYAVSRGLRVAVAPSVTPLLNDESVKRLAAIGVQAASISIDSPYPGVHDSIRGIEGVWAESIRAVKKLQAAGIRVQVNTVVMKQTVDGLADMVKLLRDIGVDTWEVFYVIPVGRAGRSLDLTPQEWEDVSNFLYEASKYGLRVRTTEGPMFRRVAILRKLLEDKGADPVKLLRLGSLYVKLKKRLQELLGPPQSVANVHIVPTRDGRGVIFVSHDGKVYPSGFLPYPVGDVRKKSLVEIYRESPLLLKLRRGEYSGRCSECEFKEVCGGSRARAFVYHGSPLAEDPACPYTPGESSRILTSLGIKAPITHYFP
ncbi:MAG: TIGR04053 family radical SAM/SPASM domain-containing protein [Desulfurococcales archaeon]|nr:TIGR04053 family radical SAM/SPASM domain-containing protein [Desulfurococcales archaeon]